MIFRRLSQSRRISIQKRNDVPLALLALQNKIPQLNTLKRINPFIKNLDLPVYNFKTLSQESTISISEKIFKTHVRPDILHKVVVTHLAGLRQGTACRKNRGEVSGGGRKLYPQKKTGRARAGSSRAPHRRGGGLAFPPKPRDFSLNLNYKELMFACRSVLAEKFNSGTFRLISRESIPTDIVKTKIIKELPAFNLEGGSLLVGSTKFNENFLRASRSLYKNLERCTNVYSPLFVYLCLKKKNLFLDVEAFKSIIAK
jgi:large subunit ribosomal protein L4